MITKEFFIKQMSVIKSYYLNFGFDANNQIMLAVWYKALSGLDEETFKAIIGKYCQENKFPPNSPTDLIDMISKNLVSKQMNSDDAWVKTNELIHRYGLIYNEDKTYKLLEDFPIIYSVCCRMRTSLVEWMYDSSQEPFVKREFKELYERELKERVKASQSAIAYENKKEIPIRKEVLELMEGLGKKHV